MDSKEPALSDDVVARRALQQMVANLVDRLHDALEEGFDAETLHGIAGERLLLGAVALDEPGFAALGPSVAQPSRHIGDRRPCRRNANHLDSWFNFDDVGRLRRI